jgi:exodeoxyribonuclease V alpha subunit
METIIQLQEIDHQFADFICRLAASDSAALWQAVARLSAAVGQGNICLDLGDVAGFNGGELAALLRATPVVGAPGEYRPLILDAADRLYLYRYWQYERDLAEAIRMLSADRPPLDPVVLQTGLARLFPGEESEPDWQRLAAATAVRSRFAVISGGPGTGKTSTVVKIIALLREQPGGETLRIALAAPTGKAAARLKESIQAARNSMQCDNAENFPEDVATIHRLLGVIPASCRFRHDRQNQLPFEVVIIDEASMVPLPLLAKLVAALAPQARLIMLGDRDQLASVEAGAVLGDICATGESHAFSAEFAAFCAEVTGTTLSPDNLEPAAVPLADAVVVLQKNYRFGGASGIGALSRAVNSGEGVAALDGLKAGRYPDVSLQPVPQQHELEAQLAESVFSGYGDYLAAADPATALDRFDRFRVLCALRQGSYGVAALNGAIEKCLAARGLIAPHSEWYQGRPVMITRNDYGRRLFNGDIGITLTDPDNAGQLAVYFRSADGGVRRFSPYRLPEHETVYAMTVHKSQGSEFERLLLIMPTFDNQVLTREILYTGMTRARSSVALWCTEEIFLATVSRRIARRSGLRQALWG